MTDLKITQLPAATLPLSGSELLEIVQGGVNKNVPPSALLAGVLTVSAFAGRQVPQYTAVGLPATNLVLPGNFGKRLRGCCYQDTVATYGAFTNVTGGSSDANPNPASPHLHGRIVSREFQANTSVGQGNGTYQNSNREQFRRPSGVSTPGGLLHWTRFFFPAVSKNSATAQKAAGNSFIGLSSSPLTIAGNLGTTGQFSTMQFLAGVGRDTTDANWQFIQNGSSGAITKVDSGIAFAGTYDDLFDAYVYSSWNSDSIVITLIDQDTGTMAQTTMTSNLMPGDQQLFFTAFCNNGPVSGGPPSACLSLVETAILMDY